MDLINWDIKQEFHFIRMHFSLDNGEKWRELWRIQGWNNWNDARDWLKAEFDADVESTAPPILNFLIKFPSKEEKTRFILTWL